MTSLADELDIGDALTWAPMRLVEPDPWVGHIPFAYWLIRALRPATVVELGTHSGNSYFTFCQAIASFAPETRAYAVDTWQGDEHAGNYGEDIFASVSAFNTEHFRQFSTLLRTTFDDARSYFPDGAIDLLHIDGMHTYEAAKHDFENWLPALSPRAVVLFHDTNVRERGFGVWRLWQELSARYPSFEFSHSHGLGVIGAGAEQEHSLQMLFSLVGTPQGAAFQRRLAARGEAFQRLVEIQRLQRQASEQAGHAEALAERVRTMDAQCAQHAGALASLASAGDAAASTLRGEVAWRDLLLASREEVLRAKEAMIASLGSAVAAGAAALHTRDSLLMARDALVADLAASGHAQRQAAAMQHVDMTAHAEAMRRDSIQAIEQAQRDALARQAAETALAATHAQLSAVQANFSTTVSAYINSTSWRITRPLRVASRMLRGGAAPAMPALLPSPVAPLLPPAPIPPDSLAAAEVTAPEDVTTETSLKAGLRTLMKARLRAFLSSGQPLVLPSAAAPAVSIILVLYNQAELTFACLSSIIETLGSAPFGVQIVIADNASTDETTALLGRLEGALILRNRANLHFLKAVNQAARAATGRTLLLLNNDAQLLPGAVASALRTLESSDDIGAVGGRIILPDGTLQEAGSIVWRDGACTGYGRGQSPEDPDFMFQRDVDYCSGAFLLTDAETFRALGGFDERYAPAYYEETDYCLRLWQRGQRVVFDPDATILHYEFGSSSGTPQALALQAANHKVFAAQHGAWLAEQWPASPLNVLAARTARSAAPRILVLEDRVPRVELGAGYPRSNLLVHELLGTGAQVAFFPMNRHEETWPSVRRALDKRVEVLIAADRSQVGAYLAARRGHFDAIIVCRPPNMASFEEAVGFHRDLIGSARVLYDAEALFVARTLQRRAAEGLPVSDGERHALIATEVSLTRLADAVISVAPAEQALLEDYGARSVALLGHALTDTPGTSTFGERDQIVFLGTVAADDVPNADALRWFATEILPKLRQSFGEALRLTVVGLVTAPSIQALDGVAFDLVGVVDSVAPALDRARVMVVPSRLGAGIPLKAYQAAMLGIPMVVTSLIAGQLGWEPGVDVLVADDPAAFATAASRLYQDEALWERVRACALARAQRDCAPERFRAGVRNIVAGVPLTHRLPDGISPPPPPTPTATPPNTSRAAVDDYSAALPFGYVPQPGSPRVAVMAHLFHTGIARELLYYVRHLPPHTTVFLTTDTADKQAELAAVFAGWPGEIEIRIVPNRGRDIAPKLVGLADAYDRFDVVLHLHSKVSDHAAFLAPWRSMLFETLAGSPATVACILDAFSRLPDLGIVAPQHFEAIRRWLGWNGNYDQASSLAKRMGITLAPGRAMDFPSGSMFWARPAALRPLLDLGLTFDDFPAEGAQLDHTPAHAIERLFFHVCERSGHSWLKVADPALLIDTRTVVSIPTPEALSTFVARHGVMLTGPVTVSCLDEPAPMMTRVAPGLTYRLAGRAL